MPLSMVVGLITTADKRQECQMAGAFYFPRKLTLAASAVPGLAARLDLARLGYITAKGIDVLIIEASAFGAVSCLTTTTTATAAVIIAFVHIAVVTVAAEAAFFSVHYLYSLICV
jgi:hypothetical protein